MKQVITFALMLTVASTCFAQNIKYIKSMEATIEKLEAAETVEDLKKVGEDFNKISKKYPKEWLPYYYEAYSLIVAAFDEGSPSEADLTIDKAQVALGEALELAPKEVEIIALQGMLYQARMSVDPMTRSMMYGMQSSQALNTAVAMDKKNPRALLLLGQNLYFTPPAFGGGIDAALKFLNKAGEQFEIYEPASSIHPNWGEKMWRDIMANL